MSMKAKAKAFAEEEKVRKWAGEKVSRGQIPLSHFPTFLALAKALAFKGTGS